MSIQSPTPIAFGDFGQNAQPVNAANPLPVAPSVSQALPWGSGAVQDMLGYSEVNIQVSGLVAGDAITVITSQDNVTFAAEAGVRRSDLSLVTSITADGTYSFGGRALFKWSKTGGGAAPTVVIRGSN